MILAAEKTSSSASAAKRMEGVLFKNWMASPNTPDDAFKTLKLDQVGIDKLFEAPMFNYWMKFMDDYVKAFPAKNIKRTMLVTTYNDQDLWRLIEAAKNNPETKEIGCAETPKQFIIAEKQPIDVAKLMNVKEKTNAN
ncbi:hypothetical protein ON010_g18281 [Phytophthora cinnamomi]|nr:hypothetical protein ON010_g18281 [Phytophthora cinnamomi]